MAYRNNVIAKIPLGNDFTLFIELVEFVKLKGKVIERKVTFNEDDSLIVNVYNSNEKSIKKEFVVTPDEGNHAVMVSFIDLTGSNMLAVGKYGLEVKGKRSEDDSNFRFYLPPGKCFDIVHSTLEGYFPSDSITTYSISGVVGVALNVGGGGIFLQVLANWSLLDSTAIDYIKNKPTLSEYVTSDSLENLLSDKQDILISGTSIKTINNLSLLGSGNLTIAGGSGVTSYNLLTDTPDLTLFITSSDLQDFVTSASLNSALDSKQSILVSGTNIKTINNQSILITGENDDKNIIIGGGTNTLVQSNWTELDTTSPAYINNKPTIPTVESVTPKILDGYWYVGNTPTNVNATGEPGDNAYVHIKYSNDAGVSISENLGQGGSYIGIYTNNSPTASTTPTSYTWTKIKGEDGVGISNIDIKYLLNNDGSNIPSSNSNWDNTLSLPIAAGNYLWTRITITTTALTNNTFTAYLVARQGQNGLSSGGGSSSSAMTIETLNGAAQPNVLYNLGTLTGATSITLDGTSLSQTAVAEYLFRFKTGTTSGHIVEFAPPQGVTILYPYDYILNLNTEYEVSILWDGSKLLVRNCAYTNS